MPSSPDLTRHLYGHSPFAKPSDTTRPCVTKARAFGWIGKNLLAALVAAALPVATGSAMAGSRAADNGSTVLATKSTPNKSTETALRTAIPSRSVPMTVGTPIAPPIGYVEFCHRQPTECISHRTKQSSKISLRSARGKLLQSVNLDVNSSITPVEDVKLYGRAEHWTYPTKAGDCEDYALLKRKRLMELGWPEQDLLLTIGFAPSGEAHTVLVVTTAEGDFVLDNRVNEIRPWTATNYIWLMRQSASNPSEWVRISQVTTE